MFTIPVITADDGSIIASESAPEEAICTITTPSGCEVYLPEDEALLTERLAAQEQQQATPTEGF